MKLVQLNIERNKHLNDVLAFLGKENADVVCLQEVMEDALPLLQETLTCHVEYQPMARTWGFEGDTEGRVIGVALLTGEPLGNVCRIVYAKGTVQPDGLPHVIHGDVDSYATGLSRVLLSGTLPDGSVVATTHFTRSPEGQVTPLQREHLDRLLLELRPFKSLVLTGDLNIPRGNELYQLIAKQFTDCVAQDIHSSLDPVLHRAGGKQLMVDYVLTTADYLVEDFRQVCGVSDHCAFVCRVERI